MKKILPRIALEGTDNRRFAIIDFLEENNIPYELQEVPHLAFNFNSKYYQRERKKPQKSYSYDDYMRMMMYLPSFDDEEINDFIEDDVLENSEFEDMYDKELLMGPHYDDEDNESIIEDYEEIEEDNDDEELEDDRYLTEYLQNIIITLSDNYDESDNKILFTAHYDAVSGSTGANDNASSVTILLKLALELTKNKPNIPVRIVFFDGEERGGIGSKYYADEYLPTEELKNQTTMINLDVCGCGDYIVIVNDIKNENHPAVKLVDSDIIDNYNILQAKSFPFSDASIFKGKGIGSIGISVFPVEDTRLLEEENEEKTKEVVGQLSLNLDTETPKTYKKHFGSYIWKYMHNGEYDDISYINYNIMQLTLDYIKNIL